MVRVIENPPAVFDEGEPYCRGEMALSAAGWAEQEQVGAGLQPGVAGGDRHDLRLGYHRHGLELERIEGLSRQEAGLGEMALDTAAVAFGQFVFGDRGQESSGGPSFLVGLIGELRPHDLDGRQAQFVEEQGEPCGVDSGVRFHAASPVGLAPSRAS